MKFLQELTALSAAVYESIKELDLTPSQNRAIEREISDLLSAGKSQDIDVEVHHVQDEGDCYKAFYTFEDPKTGKDRHGSIYFKARILDHSVEDFEEKSFNEGLTSESRSFREEPIPPFAVCYTYDGVVHKDDVYMGSRAECLEYMRTHKAKKPFTFDLMDTDSGRLVSYSLKEAGRTFTIKKPGATPEDELDDAQVVLEAQSDSKRLASQNVEAILHTKDQIQKVMRLLKARGGEDKALSDKIVTLKARLKKLTEGKLTESFAHAESMLRGKMISRVEGFFGDLQSLRYDQLETEDLAKIFFTLVEKNLVKSVIIAGFGEVAKAEDLERFLGA